MSTSTASALAAPPVTGPREELDAGHRAVVRVAVPDDHEQVAEQLRRVLAPYSDRAVVMHANQAGNSELVLALRTQDLLDVLSTMEAVRATGATGSAEDMSTAGDPDRVLSRREAEVVGLIAAGLSNRDIAARMFLTANTLKSYIRSAYRKMGVRSRSQAVAWAFSHGLTEA